MKESFGSTAEKLAIFPDSHVICNQINFFTGEIAAAQHRFRYAISNISRTKTAAKYGHSGLCRAAAAPMTLAQKRHPFISPHALPISVRLRDALI